MDLPPYGNTEKKMSEYLALAQMKQCLDAAEKRVEEAEKLADAAEKRAAAAEKLADALAQNPEGSKILKDINQLRKIETVANSTIRIRKPQQRKYVNQSQMLPLSL